MDMFNRRPSKSRVPLGRGSLESQIGQLIGGFAVEVASEVFDSYRQSKVQQQQTNLPQAETQMAPAQPESKHVTCSYCRTIYERAAPRCPSCGATSPLQTVVQTAKTIKPEPIPYRVDAAQTVKTNAPGCASIAKIFFIIIGAMTILFFLAVCGIAIADVANDPTSMIFGLI